MKKINIYIYRLWIEIDGKIYNYIGQSMNPEFRWNYESNYWIGYAGKMKKAILKYGFDRFNKEIVYQTDNEMKANYYESCFIQYFNSVQYGFNTDVCGDIYRNHYYYTPEMNPNNFKDKKEKIKFYMVYCSKLPNPIYQGKEITMRPKFVTNNTKKENRIKKEQKEKDRYYFYIMQNINTGVKRITSIHNKLNDTELRQSKDEWVIVSDCIGSKICIDHKDYKNFKHALKKRYLK